VRGGHAHYRNALIEILPHPRTAHPSKLVVIPFRSRKPVPQRIEKRRTCAYIDGQPTSRVEWLSKRTSVPLVSLFLSLRSPLLATAMACSDDRALGRVPAHGSDCGTLCRTASFRVGAFFGSVSPRVVFARVVFALVLQALLQPRVPSEGT
jgi:hypothetical protein